MSSLVGQAPAGTPVIPDEPGGRPPPGGAAADPPEGRQSRGSGWPFGLWLRLPGPDYKNARVVEEAGVMASWSRPRRAVYQAVEHPFFEYFLGAVIVVNVAAMLVEADASARSYPEPHSSRSLAALNLAALVIYTVEVLLRAYGYRGKFFSNGWNNFDLVVVLVGWLDGIASPFVSGNHEASVALDVMPMLRVLRILRLARAVRLLKFHPELNIMIMGFFGAMKAMLWGLVLMLGLFIFWAMIFIEVVHPINWQLKSERPAAVDERCDKAFGSIVHACWMLFQLLVSGDTWSRCTSPVIDYQSWTMAVFALAIASVMLGLMNLVLGVIVDRVQAARQLDQDERARHKKEVEAAAMREWRSLLDQIDLNNDGRISCAELIAGYETFPAVQESLNQMGIDRTNLREMFELMDQDESGDLSFHEFLDVFDRARSQEQRSLMIRMHLESHRTSTALKDVQQNMQLVKAVLALEELGSPASEGPMSPSLKSVMRGPVDKQSDGSWAGSLADSELSAAVGLDAKLRAMSAKIEAQYAALSLKIAKHTSHLQCHAQMLQDVQLGVEPTEARCSSKGVELTSAARVVDGRLQAMGERLQEQFTAVSRSFAQSIHEHTSSMEAHLKLARSASLEPKRASCEECGQVACRCGHPMPKCRRASMPSMRALSSSSQSQWPTELHRSESLPPRYLRSNTCAQCMSDGRCAIHGGQAAGQVRNWESEKPERGSCEIWRPPSHSGGQISQLFVQTPRQKDGDLATLRRKDGDLPTARRNDSDLQSL